MSKYKYVKATERNQRILEKYAQANAGPYPSVSGMRKNRGWGNGFVVKCGSYAYLVRKEVFDMVD